MSQTTIIREMTPSEYPLLEKFLYHSIFLPPGAELPHRGIIFEPEIHIYIKGFGGKDDCGLVAEQDGKVVGAAWTRIIPGYGHIDNYTPELAISILPEHRGRGIGTMLMKRLFELLRERGYHRMSLSVQKDNPAVRFYKRLGCVITGRKTDHANHEDYIMMKELGVSIRPWQVNDAPDLVAVINNKKVQDNLRDGIPYPYTENDANTYINTALSAEKETRYAFAITYNGEVIGSIVASRKDNIHRLTAELGYFIAEQYWGKGITTEAVRQICNLIFEKTDIVRIFAEPYACNHASCRVLEKAGFRFEGLLRQNAIKNGEIVDMKMYAILKPPSIRKLSTEDVAPAMELIWKVFSEFEAPDYSNEGIKEFRAFIQPSHVSDKMKKDEFLLWGAFEHEKIVGVIAIKPPLHIALLFVDKRFHRRGIARKLLETVMNNEMIVHGHAYITVNSSPYAVEIYRCLGFEPTDTEQTVNGLRFIPMKRKFVTK